MVMALGFLEVHEDTITCLSWAEAKLMQMCGFQPELNRCVVTGAPVRKGAALVSVVGGGYVSADAAARFPDAIAVDYEVLIGAGKIVDLDRPPLRMKHAREVLALQLRFWRSMAETDLPANRQFNAQT